MLSLKEKTMQYSFTIYYDNGEHNYANVLSRYPVNMLDDADVKATELTEVAMIRAVHKYNHTSMYYTRWSEKGDLRRSAISKCLTCS